MSFIVTSLSKQRHYIIRLTQALLQLAFNALIVALTHPESKQKVAYQEEAAGRIWTRRPTMRKRSSANNWMACGYSVHSAANTRAASDSTVSSSSTGTAACRKIGP